MKKRDEIDHTGSCLNKAEDDEPIFVLLGRDVVAPEVITHWCGLRVAVGKNGPGDEEEME